MDGGRLSRPFCIYSQFYLRFAAEHYVLLKCLGEIIIFNVLDSYFGACLHFYIDILITLAAEHLNHHYQGKQVM